MVLKYYQVALEVSFQESPGLLNTHKHLGSKHTGGQTRGSYTPEKIFVLQLSSTELFFTLHAQLLSSSSFNADIL